MVDAAEARLPQPGAASVTVSSPSIPPARMKKTVASPSKSRSAAGHPAAEQHLAVVPHGIALAVGRHHAQVEVRVGVGRAGDVGSVQVAARSGRRRGRLRRSARAGRPAPAARGSSVKHRRRHGRRRVRGQRHGHDDDAAQQQRRPGASASRRPTRTSAPGGRTPAHRPMVASRLCAQARGRVGWRQPASGPAPERRTRAHAPAASARASQAASHAHHPGHHHRHLGAGGVQLHGQQDQRPGRAAASTSPARSRDRCFEHRRRHRHRANERRRGRPDRRAGRRRGGRARRCNSSTTPKAAVRSAVRRRSSARWLAPTRATRPSR